MGWKISPFATCIPVTHSIAQQLDERRDRAVISTTLSRTAKFVADRASSLTFTVVPRYFFDLRKMQKKHLSFEQLFDIRVVRILTHSLKDCYAALGVAPRWRHLSQSLMIMWQRQNRMATNRSTWWRSVPTTKMSKFKFVAMKCTMMQNSGCRALDV